MWLLLKWPAGQWGSRQEGVQMSRKIVYDQCIFIAQKWSKHLFSAVMRHCKERSIVYLALLGLHLKTLPEAQRKQDIVWVWNLVTTFAILYISCHHTRLPPSQWQPSPPRYGTKKYCRQHDHRPCNFCTNVKFQLAAAPLNDDHHLQIHAIVNFRRLWRA